MSSQGKRIFCAYHETEFLTNFCQEMQCLMPLCPSCISEHTQEHFEQGTKPSYININEALTNAKQKCYYAIVALDEYKSINAEIYEYISSLKANIHQQLQISKQEIYSLIEAKFEEYEERLFEQILQDYKEKSVYDIDEALNASKYIEDEISMLYQKITFLKSDDCLSTLITFKATDEQQYEERLKEFQDYVDKNHRIGRIEISLQTEKLKAITEDMCDKLLFVESVVQILPKQTPPTSELTPGRSKRYGFNKGSNTGGGDKENLNQFNNLSVGGSPANESKIKSSEKQNLQVSPKQISFNVESKANRQSRMNLADRLKFRREQTTRHLGHLHNPSFSQTYQHEIYSEGYRGSPKRLTRGFKKF